MQGGMRYRSLCNRVSSSTVRALEVGGVSSRKRRVRRKRLHLKRADVHSPEPLDTGAGFDNTTPTPKLIAQNHGLCEMAIFIR